MILTTVLWLLLLTAPAWAFSAYHAEVYNWSSALYNGAKATIYTPNHNISVPGQTIKSVVRGPEFNNSDWLPQSPINYGLAEIGWYWLYPHATPWAYFTSCNGYGQLVISDYTDLGINQSLDYRMILQGSYEPYYYYNGGTKIGEYNLPWGFLIWGIAGESPSWDSTTFKWHSGGRQATSSLQMESWVHSFALRSSTDGHWEPNHGNNRFVSSPFTISMTDPANFEVKANWPY
jgi:hypothetical protein